MSDFIDPFKDEMKKIPGLAWVVAMVFLAVFAGERLELIHISPGSEIVLVTSIWLACWFFHRLGSPLDDLLFDRLFSPFDNERGSIGGGLNKILLPRLEKVFLESGSLS